MNSHCRNWCTMEDRCTSINMGPEKKDKVLCQLSDSDHVQHPDDLKSAVGFMYRKMEVKINNLQIISEIVHKQCYERLLEHRKNLWRRI